MSYNPSYPSVFMPDPNQERVAGSTPLLPAPYSSSIQAQPDQQQGYITAEQWQQAIDAKTAELQAASGFERTKLQAQIDDATKARDNAVKLAQLQADTSRYGVDQQRETAMAQLKQNAAQFEANHQLDLQKFGLSVGELTGVYNGQPTLAAKGQQLTEAQLIAEQRSQPNRLFQTMDLEQALNSVRNGRPATTMPMTGVAAVDRLSTDYQGNPYLAGGGTGAGAGTAGSTSTGMGANTGASTDMAPAGGSGQGPAPDPRIKAIRAVTDALPPSVTDGLDPSGVAALNAVFHLYNAPLAPNTLNTLSPTQQQTLQSGAERIQGVTGQSYDDLMASYKRNGIGQGATSGY